MHTTVMTIPMEAFDFKGGSDEGRRLGRRFRRRLSKKTVPTKAADWEIIPTTVPPWVLDQDDGSEEGYGLGRRLRV
jgi:hypothetical protein